MADKGYSDFAASRAHYAAFYAATAVLLSEGIEASKHSGVVASIHQRLVKTGKLKKEHGRNLTWLFELRSTPELLPSTELTRHLSRARRARCSTVPLR